MGGSVVLVSLLVSDPDLSLDLGLGLGLGLDPDSDSEPYLRNKNASTRTNSLPHYLTPFTPPLHQPHHLITSTQLTECLLSGLLIFLTLGFLHGI